MRSNAILPKKLGKNIQNRRKEMRLTQEDLAEKVKISRAYMGFIEQGRNTPSIELLEVIAKALRVSISEFFR